MSLWTIAWRSIQQRALASVLTAISVALGVTLVVAVLVIYQVIQASFLENAEGYNMIVGAKGGRLQLVLNTVYYLSRPTQNVPYSFYKEFTQGRFKEAVETAVPICMGDNYKGYRVIGTVPEIFQAIRYSGGRKVEFAQGKPFGENAYYEAVVGAVAAREAGLKLGDTFRPTHGVETEAGQGHEHEPFTVVGILAPSGTPNDRALFINMEGFYRLDGHTKAPPPKQLAAGKEADKHDEHEEHDADKHDADKHEEHAHADHDHEHHSHEPMPDDLKEVTAILVRTSSSKLQLAMALPKLINQEPVAQAVLPVQEIRELFDSVVGPVQKLLLVLASLVVVVAGISILVSIYNSMTDRRHEIAVMRSLGAGRATVMRIVLLESILLSLSGGILGLVIGHSVIGVLSPVIMARFGVMMTWYQFQWAEIVLIPGLVVLASVVGYLPAVAAYRTDVSKWLRAAP
jgi:putative ABC transport system permease protein